MAPLLSSECTRENWGLRMRAPTRWCTRRGITTKIAGYGCVVCVQYGLICCASAVCMCLCYTHIYIYIHTHTTGLPPGFPSRHEGEADRVRTHQDHHGGRRRGVLLLQQRYGKESVYVSVHVCACGYVCGYLCTVLYMYIYIHIHTYIHTLRCARDSDRGPICQELRHIRAGQTRESAPVHTQL
jgi:hypothetical protein